MKKDTTQKEPTKDEINSKVIENMKMLIDKSKLFENIIISQLEVDQKTIEDTIKNIKEFINVLYKNFSNTDFPKDINIILELTKGYFLNKRNLQLKNAQIELPNMNSTELLKIYKKIEEYLMETGYYSRRAQIEKYKLPFDLSYFGKLLDNPESHTLRKNKTDALREFVNIKINMLLGNTPLELDKRKVLKFQELTQEQKEEITDYKNFGLEDIIEFLRDNDLSYENFLLILKGLDSKGIINGPIVIKNSDITQRQYSNLKRLGPIWTENRLNFKNVIIQIIEKNLPQKIIDQNQEVIKNLVDYKNNIKSNEIKDKTYELDELKELLTVLSMEEIKKLTDEEIERMVETLKKSSLLNHLAKKDIDKFCTKKKREILYYIKLINSYPNGDVPELKNKICRIKKDKKYSRLKNGIKRGNNAIRILYRIDSYDKDININVVQIAFRSELDGDYTKRIDDDKKNYSNWN